MRDKFGFSATRSLIIVVILGAAGHNAYLRFKTPSPVAVQDRTHDITRVDLVQSVTANVSLVPVRLADRGSQISGVTTEFKADFNSHVKEGDIITPIDPPTAELVLGQADAKFSNAETAATCSIEWTCAS